MQLLPADSSSSRCSPRPQKKAVNTPQIRSWREFLRRPNPALGSTIHPWIVQRAKEKAAAWNAANAKALVTNPRDKPLDRVRRTLPATASGPSSGLLALPPPPAVADPVKLSSYVRRPGFNYMGLLMHCELVPGEVRCTYTGGHLEWQCPLPATDVHPLGPTQQPLQQLCSLHYVSYSAMKCGYAFSLNMVSLILHSANSTIVIR